MAIGKLPDDDVAGDDSEREQGEPREPKDPKDPKDRDATNRGKDDGDGDR